jgi:hypothetical protein
MAFWLAGIPQRLAIKAKSYSGRAKSLALVALKLSGLALWPTVPRSRLSIPPKSLAGGWFDFALGAAIKAYRHRLA